MEIPFVCQNVYIYCESMSKTYTLCTKMEYLFDSMNWNQPLCIKMYYLLWIHEWKIPSVHQNIIFIVNPWVKTTLYAPKWNIYCDSMNENHPLCVKMYSLLWIHEWKIPFVHQNIIYLLWIHECKLHFMHQNVISIVNSWMEITLYIFGMKCSIIWQNWDTRLLCRMLFIIQAPFPLVRYYIEITHISNVTDKV